MTREEIVTWNLPRSYTASQLVYAVRHARAHPSDRYMTPDRSTLAAAEFLRWFRRCLQRKINAGPCGSPSRPPYGRKDGGDGLLSDYERAALQTARRVNTPRLIVRETEVPFELRDRLRHRIYREEDF